MKSGSLLNIRSRRTWSNKAGHGTNRCVFPVQRDRFAVASDTVQQGVRMLTFTDYHPFLNVRALVDAIAAAGGYTVASTFMDSAFFRALYISGRYPEKEVEPLAERMGFLAGRFADATAVATGSAGFTPIR